MSYLHGSQLNVSTFFIRNNKIKNYSSNILPNDLKAFVLYSGPIVVHYQRTTTERSPDEIGFELPKLTKGYGYIRKHYCVLIFIFLCIAIRFYFELIEGCKEFGRVV